MNQQAQFIEPTGPAFHWSNSVLVRNRVLSFVSALISASADVASLITYANSSLLGRSSPEKKMVRKQFQQAKTGIEALKAMDANKYLKKVGLGRDDMFFWKQVGKALMCTYTIFGLAWIYNETSPLGWWTLKPRPKEERELAHLYERREFPYPGDTEAMEDFVAKGGMIGTAIGPKGIVESEGEADNYQKEMEKKKFDKEAQKLWLRMRNEVMTELQEKGYDLE